MSFSAARESKQVRQICQSCRDRKARFQYRGIVKADRDHRALLPECYRSEANRQRAQRLVPSVVEGLAAVPSALPLRSPFFPDARQLTDAEIAHRRQMLAYLQRSRANG